MEFFYSIVGFFQKGGLFMYPILFVFLAGMGIALERWAQLSRIRGMKPIFVWRKIWVSSKAISKTTKNMFGIHNFSVKSAAVLRPRLKIYVSLISCKNYYQRTRMNTDYRDVESDKKNIRGHL